MQNINSIAELKDAIQILEVEQTMKGRLLKDNFSSIVHGFKPANLIAGVLQDVTKSPMLIDNILGIVMGLSTGSLTKSIFIGGSGSKIRRIVGTVLQYGIANTIANHSGLIKTVGTYLIQNLLRKRLVNIERP